MGASAHKAILSPHKSGKTPFIAIMLNKTTQSAVWNGNEIKECMEQSYDKEWERFTHCQMEESKI